MDLFCGAGGCSAGYVAAGFAVVGVDISPQPRYPYQFIQSDWQTYLREHWQKFDVIHASPPCQAYSATRRLTKADHHPELVDDVRQSLKATGKPYVIENVPGAPLHNPLMLCGTMFNLGVIRHRLFECCPTMWFPPMPCAHIGKTLPMWGKSRRQALERGEQFSYVIVAGNSFLIDEAKAAMGIEWMTRKELSQAIPPAYTEWIGQQLMKTLSPQ